MLQLREKTIEIDGNLYPLRCNMAVLERLQEGPGKGEIGNLLKQPTYKVIFEILKAMLDEACEDDPDLPVVTMRKLKKLYSPAQLGALGVFRLFSEALDVPPEAESESDTAAADPERGN